MKFFHAADLHLDSPLRGLSAYPEAPVERLRTATRDALQNLVGRAIEERVDFVVIAGDVYDGDWRDFNTGLFFVRQMGRLRQAGIPVYLLHGNHDAESEMTRSLQMPDNVHVFPSRKAATFRIDSLRVALHGRSFRVAATTENLLPGYPDPVPGWLNIGVLHTALEGNAEHASYAPCSVAELDARGYQYWALGHVHRQWIRHGASVIAYPGNLQGRHIRETGARGALLVTAEADEITGIEPIEVDVLRWHALEIDAGGIEDLAGAARAAGQALSTLLGQTEGDRPLAVRVSFTGASPAHGRLAGQEAQLRHEVISQAVALAPDRIWIEKVRVGTHPRHDERARLGGDGADALADLETLAKAALQDEAFVEALRAHAAELIEKLPHDVLKSDEGLAALRDDPLGQMRQRAGDAIPMLVARVGSAPGASD
ncbi:MAG: hypothetical protein RIS35_2576 [Pseudomonadota bacterium]|jgi:DNA repair exonuclease SbcCD nuclease subunit